MTITISIKYILKLVLAFIIKKIIYITQSNENKHKS